MAASGAGSGVIASAGLPCSGACDSAGGSVAGLGSDERSVIERIDKLQERGLICRFGAFFDAESLGYKGRLVAARVAPEHLSAVALAINALPQVSHNDERDNDYNLWFTVQSRQEEEILRLIDMVAQMDGVEEVISMPTSERFKVNVEFQVK